MSREIKFRAWDKNNNKMVYSGKKYTNGGLLDWFEDEDLMQYTGLKDKNGKEIYEGDIVKDKKNHPRMKLVVKYEGVGFSIKDIKNGDCQILFYNSSCRKQENIEIIGNIYENPELLKG